MTDDRFKLGRVLMADVTPSKVDWLWPGRLPLGKLTLLEGDPGTGKSTLTLEIAARVSRGEALPGGTPMLPRGVVLWTAEDDLSDTVAPRLIAAGADMTRIVAREFVLGAEFERRPPTLDDVETLLDDIQRVDAAFLLVDPLVAFLLSGTNIYNDMQVRRALGPLADLAAETGIAAVGVRHLHKRASGNPIYAGGGSIGFAGAARSVLLCGKDPDDATGERRVLARSKSNLAGSVPALAFRLAAAGDVSRVEWLGESTHTAASLLVPKENAPSPGDEAGDFLMDWLRDGPVGSAVLFEAAGKEGVAHNTLRRAAERLGVEKKREGFGSGSKVYWALPGAIDTQEPA